jgi:hypothetical protein
MGCFTMNRLKELGFFVLVLLAGCQSIQALDERLSERIRRANGLKPETTVAWWQRPECAAVRVRNTRSFAR